MKQEKLPELYRTNMQTLLGVEFGDYISSFDARRNCGLRINQAKISAEGFKEICPFKLEDIPWISNGYYYQEDEKPAKSPYYYAGLYYLQEPSAMTPASLLPVKPGDMVLDLCAAPGGKSTELGARLKGSGMLVANDISNSRAKALLKNLELFGIPNICVTSECPEKIARAFPCFFDSILIDAPCSGEGMFRKDDGMIKSWLDKGPEYYAGIQKEIVKDAVRMLKPGGYLLYSTCTFSVMENEDTIQYLLDICPDMELQKIPLFEGVSGGIGLDGPIRLYPHKIRGEGHFIALLRKKEDEDQNHPAAAVTLAPKKSKLPKELTDFLQQINMTFEEDRIFVKEPFAYYLPRGFHPPASLRYLRTGLLLGEMKKGRFEPSQALAMALKAENFPVIVSFSVKDDRVIRYLKGETILLQEQEYPVNGWCLVCVGGFPLGFAKGTGASLKNKYYPGWRWQ